MFDFLSELLTVYEVECDRCDFRLRSRSEDYAKQEWARHHYTEAHKPELVVRKPLR
jgi:hypothetical protein